MMVMMMMVLLSQRACGAVHVRLRENCSCGKCKVFFWGGVSEGGEVNVHFWKKAGWMDGWMDGGNLCCSVN